MGSRELIIDVFEFIEKPYSPRTTSHFRLRKIYKRKYGIETPYSGPKLWNLAPNEYKTIESLEELKAKIKTWVPENILQVMQNIYSPRGFYLISRHDNSQVLIKSQ